MKGRPFLGVICGFFFGVFLSLLLLTTGVLATDSIVLAVLPFVFLVVGLVLAAAAPFKRSRLDTAPATTTTTAPPPVAPPPPADPV